jgi:hypothetical protein
LFTVQPPKSDKACHKFAIVVVIRLYLRPETVISVTANTPTITETPDAFIVNGVAIPKMKRAQMNVYDPALIKAIGADLFFLLVSPKVPIPIPDLGF